MIHYVNYFMNSIGNFFIKSFFVVQNEQDSDITAIMKYLVGSEKEAAMFLSKASQLDRCLPA